jgi:urea transporter
VTLISGTRQAIAYCFRRQHLRRTVRIALVVGVVLTAINQLDIILAGDATTITWMKCPLNFIVPFVVSNLGLLSGRPRSNDVDAAPGRRAAHEGR